MSTRKIVVRDKTYRWTLLPGDDGLRVAIRGEARRAGRLVAWFDHSNLVTPYSVRTAIERAVDDGWDPDGSAHATVGFDGAQRDRPVAVASPPELGELERELLERIADAPASADDLAARLVYADFLQEAGDPQGELIALACAAAARELSRREGARLAELEAAREAWLGPVGALVHRAMWHRGVLDACVLARTQSGVVDAAMEQRGWRTIRLLDARGGFLATLDIARLVSQRALVSLRDLTVPGDVAGLIASGERAFPRLARFQIDSDRGAPHAAVVRDICTRMPSLRELVVAPLTQLGLAGILRANTARTLVVRDGQLSLAKNASRILAEAAPRGLDALVLVPWGPGYDTPHAQLTFRRSPDATWSELTLRGPHDTAGPWRDLVEATLASLPADSLTRVTFEPPNADALFARVLATQRLS